ncbi:hypothetical protein BDBG_17644 [Blastomyces gilchristii SLH14081]|uniref:Uncharacterized protein n=1 Tax=Blastomyces gilchristii (strain SLH14081) TaxID=559298 RepID=A0A179UYI7_BLAGS|nr:uncharacterized protein BDBG_17644 [Blastomyces gilchristii SLH14081]OAT12279.1 hypothetical protein BDBG_17644 [Blastomyces gilchristii SLH14081]
MTPTLLAVPAQEAENVGGPAVGRPFYQQALVVIELFCPSSLQIMRLLSMSPAVINMHGFNPRMNLKICNKYSENFNSVKRHLRSVF